MADNTYTQSVTIVNSRGLHARAAAKLAKLVKQYRCSIKITHNGVTACAKDILDLLTLAASQGSEVSVKTYGCSDAKKAMQSVIHLIESGFEEDTTLCPIESRG